MKKQWMKTISKMLVMMMSISLCLGGMGISASADGSGTVGADAGNAPTVTYNVSGLDFGARTESVDGVGENYHVYGKGAFEPGKVELWGTVTNNRIGASDVFVSAKISYADSKGVSYVVDEIGYIYVNGGAVADYRLSGTIPEDSSHVTVTVGAGASWNAYVSSSIRGEFYLAERTSTIPGEKTVGINVPSGVPTITYNVRGIDLGIIKDDVDGVSENSHNYDDGRYEPGLVEVFGTVRNSAVGSGTIFYKAYLTYKDADGQKHTEETEYIDVGPSYTSDYHISMSIPADATNVYMSIGATAWWNAYINTAVRANLYPGEVTVQATGSDTGTSIYSNTDTMVPLTFTDFDESHWAYEYVQYMVELGIISGYPDGTFRPNDTFNRAAFAKLLSLSFELPAYTGSQVLYEDLPTNHWAYTYVMGSNAFLTSYEKTDGSKVYAPDNDAVREDVAVAMVKAMGLDPDDADVSYLSSYIDANQVSNNLREYVALAIEYGVMQGSNSQFRPQDPLTRAEASTLFARFLMEIKGTYEDDGLIKVTN